MYVVIGFESQIAARGAAAILASRARTGRLTIAGAAIVRRDTEGGFHVDPYRELAPSLPAHPALVVDSLVEGSGRGDGRLRPGQAALLISIAGEMDGELEDALERVRDGQSRALWIDAVSRSPAS
jgi:hypothetical protein